MGKYDDAARLEQLSGQQHNSLMLLFEAAAHTTRTIVQGTRENRCLICCLKSLLQAAAQAAMYPNC